MITEVSHNLFVADMEGCNVKNAAIIHACKHPCFENSVGKKLSECSYKYISFESGNNLYLNIIDPIEPLFYRETFDDAILFIKKHIKERKVIIHCNFGLSRSPAIAMLYLFNKLPYLEAKNRLLDIYDRYEFGFGIDTFLFANWGFF